MRREWSCFCHHSKKGSVTEDLAEPGSCIVPFLARDVDRDAQGGCDFLVSQTGELAKFDHLGSDRVFRSQPIQGFVEGVEVVFWVWGRHICEVGPLAACAPF